MQTGICKKEGHIVKNWKERFFVIIKDLMLYYKNERDCSQRLPPVGYYVVLKVEFDSKLFTVTSQGGKVFKLTLGSSRNSKDFLNAIQRACNVTSSSDQTRQYAGHPQLQLVG